MSTSPSTYGREIAPSAYNRERSLIQSPSLSDTDNLILRVGREWTRGGSWHQTEHVVLTPTETVQFIAEVAALQPCGFTPEERSLTELAFDTMEEHAPASLDHDRAQSVLRKMRTAVVADRRDDAADSSVAGPDAPMVRITAVPSSPRMPVRVAATYAVSRFGEKARDLEIVARRGVWDLYWTEVERLLAGGKASRDAAERAGHLMRAQGEPADAIQLA